MTNKQTEYKECPRCNEMTLNADEVMNSLSRKDNSTYICNNCGVAEAMEELEKLGL